jgi:lipopolysaccharide export system ATP-binding protein
LITEPSLIMLDEPFAGIDPKTVKEIQGSIRELAEQFHIGILLTDHEFRETLEVTDRNYLIYQGRVVAEGNRVEFLENPDVRRYYLGERADVGHLLEDRSPHHAGPKPVAQASVTSPAAPPKPKTELPSLGAGTGTLPPEPPKPKVEAPSIPHVHLDPLLDAFGPVILDPSYGHDPSTEEDDDPYNFGPSSR